MSGGRRHRWILGTILALACGTGGGTSDASDPEPGTDTGGVDIAADAPLADPSADPGVPGELPSADAGDTLDPGSELPPPAATFRLFDLSAPGNVRAVWASQEASLWAVGDGGLALRFDGTAFVPVPAPTTRDLLGVSGDGSTVFAVGAQGTVLRHDGAGWSALPAPSDADLAAVGVLDADDLFVAGRGGVLFRWQGGKWTPQATGLTYDLWGLSASRAGGVFAVGAYGTLIELQGSAWLRTQAAGPSTILRSVWRAPDGRMFAVGTGGTVAKFDGTSWKLQVTNDGQDRDLWAVAGLASDDVLAVGDRGVVLRHDGKKWTTQPVAGPYNREADLRGLGVLAGETPVLVAAGLESKALEFRDKAWQDRPLGLTADLRGVILSGDGALAVGDRGLVLRFADDRFTALDTPTSADLASVSGRWAVGAGGTLLDVGSTPVTQVPTATQEDLVDVWSADPLAWIAGANGGVYRVSGGKVEARLALAMPLTAICASGAHVFASAADGRLFRVEGASAIPIPSGAPGALRDLAPLPGGRIAAAGDNGIVLDCDAAGCRTLHEDPATFLYGIATEGEQIVTAGWAGALLRGTASAGLAPVATGTWRVFRSVAVAPDGRAFLAGLSGTFALDEVEAK